MVNASVQYGVAALCLALAFAGSPASADTGDCAQPVSAGSAPAASDCLFILKAAVGSETCAVECVCAPKGDLPISASDALLCLKFAVGQPIVLDCPCGVTTTTLPESTGIQAVQDGTIGTGETVTLTNVFVNGFRLAFPSGDLTFFLQEPLGATTGGHDYPEYAGVRAFTTSDIVSTIPDLYEINIGECVATLTGETGEFQGATIIENFTAFEIAANQSSCGTFAPPASVPGIATFAELATDIDPVTAGDQPGARAEVFEGVLLTVSDVTVQSLESSDDFRVTDSGLAANLFVRQLDGSHEPVLVGQSFSSITGVLTQGQVAPGVFSYQLVPRSAADFIAGD